MEKSLLYQAARQGTFGKHEEFSRSSITDTLFVYLDGVPEPESLTRVDSYFRNRPLVCLTREWEEQIKTKYPEAAVYRRTAMKAACVARMLQDCMERGITVHWDAQNDISRHLAEKFGFEAETEYLVYRLP